MSLNQERLKLNVNIEYEDKIISVQNNREKLLENAISEIENFSEKNYCDNLLKNLKSLSAQQQEHFNMISNDYKRSNNLFSELKQINVCFKKDQTHNLHDNISKNLFPNYLT